MMDIGKRLEMFSPGKLSDLLVIYDHLTADGVSMEDLRTWLNERTSQMQKQVETEKEQIEKLIKKYAVCPDCGAQMQVVPAYGPIKTRFACTKCDLALDSQDPPSRWIYKFMEKEEDKSNVQQIATEKQTDTAESGNDQKAGAVGNGGKSGEDSGNSAKAKDIE
jgi:ribosomal protein S27AE